MASPSEKLVSSLEALKKLQDQGLGAIRSADLTRTHRERLLKHGFLQEVMKGWYIPARLDDAVGESTAWYASYWEFCATYLTSRFGSDWCLSPEQSLQLHAGNMQVPVQLLVRSSKARNKVTNLPHGTSLFDVKASLPSEQDIDVRNGLRLFSLPVALMSCSPSYYRQCPTELRTALVVVKDASALLRALLDGGHSTIAGRLAGAFRNIGRDRLADEILSIMRAADFDVREHDPFEEKLPSVGNLREENPLSVRIRLMWQRMRADIVGRFLAAKPKKDVQVYLADVDDIYATDAYHSLSIEGYRVNHDLIERVRSGDWNPDAEEVDRQQRDAMAARGYWQAFQKVRESVKKCLEGENPGRVADEDHGGWYRELFAPSVAVGLLKPSDLAGYRSTAVYIRRSMHVPPSSESVRGAMQTLFELLEAEEDPTVRIVLGHFIFVYIHPYTDGNGRTGRFLMNVMMAEGGYPWTIIPVERRSDYMSALEAASVEGNIVPFADFIASCIVE
ncbi:Fic family protein [Kordiimonas pumila]|uniref:Fic family protein n=1 Tax=Kordiimonas pumila TaxID=2161677 RepID=A0ABV7D9A6_9PROT|nr:Fic family protein [Kordiimonas pumila]